jgi:hypothetical protein
MRTLVPMIRARWNTLTPSARAFEANVERRVVDPGWLRDPSGLDRWSPLTPTEVVQVEQATPRSRE